MPRTQHSSHGPAWKQGQDARRLPVVPIVIGVIALIAVIALVASSLAEEDDATEGQQQVGPVAVSGDPLPRFGDSAGDPAVGTAAPRLEGQSFDGSSVEIGDDGRPKVVVFLAHHCPHCQAEVPRIVDWFGDNGVPDDVDVYGVATGTSEDLPNYPPSRWLDREEWDRPTMADDEDSTAASAFGLSAYPYFVALDADHEVVARGTGELSAQQWESLLDAARA